MKYSQIPLKPAAILISLALIFTASCQLDVPMKEMVAAKTAIESARGVDAEKYSPDELKKADELLLQSHNLLAEKKEKEARQAAEDSLAAAIGAEKKALPPYADERLKKAEEAYLEADRAFAEKFSPEKFSSAGVAKDGAKQKFDSGEYRESAALSDQAYTLALEAKDESLANSSAIEGQLSSLRKKYDELKGNRYSSSADENLARADTAITAAKSGLENKEYKTAMQEIRNAGTELDAADLIIIKKGMYAKIEELRGEMNSVKKGAVSEDVNADLDKALLALNSAEASLEQNYMEDAALRIKEAEDLISGADSRLKEKRALAALERAEKLLAQAKGKDTALKHSENLNKAENLITEGKTNIEGKKFNEGISNAEEAETIIAAVLNSMESEKTEEKIAVETGVKEEVKKDESAAEEKKVSEEKQPEGKIYVVQWRKKNTDCLWRIAQKVYKDAAYWPAIYIANRDQIKDPDLIFPGQKFVIPPKPQKRPSYKKIMEEEKAKEKAKSEEKTDAKGNSPDNKTVNTDNKSDKGEPSEAK